MNIAVVGTSSVGTAIVKKAHEHGHTVTAFGDADGAFVDTDGIDVANAVENRESRDLSGTDPLEVALDASYDVLIEATPTSVGHSQPGYEHVRAAFKRDRDVVLVNKGLLAERYRDLRQLEEDSLGELRFEATVVGTIPVMTTIQDLDPTTISAVRGIFNGPSNFILTRMATEGLNYESVLAEVQELGIADADPTFDVDGIDAALQCVIVANVLEEGNSEYTLDDAAVEGIADLPGSALDLAVGDGRTIRLVGEVSDDQIRVGPRLIPEQSSLAVSGTDNIVQLETKHAGRLNISGRGADISTTATAALMDVSRLS